MENHAKVRDYYDKKAIREAAEGKEAAERKEAGGGTRRGRRNR
jgi:hypothetical protein